jgi:hypothetical protein
MQRSVHAGAERRKDIVVTRLMAVLAIVWAGAWLLLVLVPGGELHAVDRGYDLMLKPFEDPGAGSVVRRLIELACLLPAALFLAMAQAFHRRRLGRDRQAR